MPENESPNAAERLNEPALIGELLPAPVEDIEVPRGRGPFSPDERAQVVRWIEGGKSRNWIVNTTGRGNATITRIAQAHGLAFLPAEQFKTANEVRNLSVRARKLALRDKLIGDAERLRESLWQPTTIIQLSNRSGEFVRTKIKEPTFADKRNIATSLGIIMDKLADLERLDAPQEGKQAIIALVDTLRIQLTRETRLSEGGDVGG